MNYDDRFLGDLLGRVLPASPLLRDRLERRRRDDTRERRATPRFDTYESIDEMVVEHPEDAPRYPGETRTARERNEAGRKRHQWCTAARERNDIYTPRCERQLTALTAYANGLYRDAAQFCGASWLGDPWLLCVRGHPALPFLGSVASQPLHLGAGASSFVAGLNGDVPWRPATRQAWHRALASGREADDGSIFYVELATIEATSFRIDPRQLSGLD